jgi:phytol kinase
MSALIVSVLVVFLVLCLSELGWRRHILQGELGRKFIHITVGTFVAFWPFFLSWGQIRLLAVAFVAVVLISQYFHLFHAIRSVQRPTYGDVLFAAIVGVLTFVTQDKDVYAAAILQMSLADGFAAVFGSTFGKRGRYAIFGQTKSMLGTITFFIVSLLILLWFSLYSAHGLPVVVVLGGSLAATLIENLAVFGFDNLLIPLFIGLLLMRA